MPAIIVPQPPPLVRQMCYLPEHYPPFAPHEPNCLCSFCVHKWYAESIKAESIKELPKLSAEEILLEFEEKILLEPVEIPVEEEEIIFEPLARGLKDFPIPHLSRSTNDPSTWGAEDDEDIFLLDLSRVTRGLQDFPIPRLTRSTNDPSTWEAADEEEILLF